MHTYYSKPMSSKQVVMRSSALSEKMRNNILVSDLVRIMRCVSPLCDPAERTKHVQHFIHRMQLSGYSQNQRAIVYKAAKKRYDQQLKNHNEGVTPLYRSKQWHHKERCINKQMKKNERGRYEATYFVQATPGSQLAKQCQQVFRQCDLDICVIERPGKTIKQMMTKSNPFDGPECKCEVCAVSNKPICRVRECVYKISCSLCGACYIGETSRSMHERYHEHMSLFNRGIASSTFLQHTAEKHQGNAGQVKWMVKVLQRCPGDPGLRQATEATLIRAHDPELNRKAEFGDSNRRRIVTST